MMSMETQDQESVRERKAGCAFCDIISNCHRRPHFFLLTMSASVDLNFNIERIHSSSCSQLLSAAPRWLYFLQMNKLF